MKCQLVQEKFPDFLIGDLDENTKENVQSHLLSCGDCREELESLSVIWTKLGVLPEEHPSNGLRPRFYTMLENFKRDKRTDSTASNLRKSFNVWLQSWLPKRPSFQIASAMMLLGVGLICGYFLNTSGKRGEQVAQLRDEVRGMRQTLAVSLLEKSSPSERLRGVGLSQQLENPDPQILDKLLHTVNNDSNINVRLSAVDALYLFHNNPNVKEGLLDSLSNQTSPLVQVALIDLIASMKETRAIESLKQLIQDEQLNPDVKQHAEKSILLLTEGRSL